MINITQFLTFGMYWQNVSPMAKATVHSYTVYIKPNIAFASHLSRTEGIVDGHGQFCAADIFAETVRIAFAWLSFSVSLFLLLQIRRIQERFCNILLQ